MRSMFRRNTSPGPAPPSPRDGDNPVIGFGIPNTIEKLKKGPGYKFRERDRVKVIAPREFKHRTGYIVETNERINKNGLVEVELDHEFKDDGCGYAILKEGEDEKAESERQRLTVKNPNHQLIPYKYMQCQSQHFATSFRADAILQMSFIATYILGFEIMTLLFAAKQGAVTWNHYELFVTYMLFSSFSIGLGFFVVSILSFIGFSLKRISGENKQWQNGDVRDECMSYHWLKSTHWKPWWLCGRDVSMIEFILKQTAIVMVVFIATFILSILFYIADQIEWYLVCVCMLFIGLPPLFALHVIKKREMLSF